MNVDQLRRVLAEIPGDMPIVIEDCQMGWMANAALYVAPAHVDRRITGNFLRAHHEEGADNCHALLITSLGQTDLSVVDLTPRCFRPEVVDVEPDAVDSVTSFVHQQKSVVAACYSNAECEHVVGGSGA